MEAADGHFADPVKADDMAGMGGTDRKLLLDVLHQVSWTTTLLLLTVSS